MRFEIQRAKKYFNEAERGIRALHPDSRYPVWAALMRELRRDWLAVGSRSPIG
jgi:phytoene/squalene synthetase